MKILLTSTSFQDTPGAHHNLLQKQGFELDFMRGPLKENIMLSVISNYDAIICGDDEITREVIQKGAKNRLKIISKYGIGLDKIDLIAAKEFNIPVRNCPGVNNLSVAEHAFALLLSFVKNIIPEYNHIRKQNWTRLIGTEVFGKCIGIIGLGNVGKEIAKRALAFGMKVIAIDKFIDQDFIKNFNIEIAENLDQLLNKSDFISLNLSLDEESKDIINTINLINCKNGVVIINTARSGLISEETIISGIERKIISGYLTDVLDEEPMKKDHPFLKYDNIIITPHIGSRTYESVVRQGSMAVTNLLEEIKKLEDV